MKLYWSPRSPYVRKVMICAHETGLADRIEPVLAVVAMTRPHLGLMRENPLGKIPTLVTDDGQILFDSAVICEYLDGLHDGPRLFPAAPAARWRALRWHALGDGMLDLLILWRNELLRPQSQRSTEILAAFELKINNAVSALEHEAAAITKAPFGIGHIAIGCALGYIDFRFPGLGWRHGNGAIAAWFDLFALRPAARMTAPLDNPL
jgi:glutathione S-transferase